MFSLPRLHGPVPRLTASVLVLVAGTLLLARSVFAQSPTATPQPTAGWQNGFVIQSADASHRLAIGTIVQVDGRFSVDDPLPITNTFTIRKGRIILAGRAARFFEFRLMPDFGGGSTVLMDAYLDLRLSPAFRLRAGKDKTPFGYELLVADAALLFPERSLPSSLAPNRDIGVQAQGDIADKLTYAVGVFNGVPDGVSTTTDLDVNSTKDVAGRVVLQPFRTTQGTPGPLNGLGLHLGVSRGTQSGTLPAFRTSVGQTYFSYVTASALTPGATAAGDRTRFTPAVFYYYKGFGAFGEFSRSTQRVGRADVTRDITNTGWGITGAFNLTGEAASPAVVTPAQPFDPSAGGIGAFQLVARYSELAIDDEVFEAGLATPNSSRDAQQFSVGVNWYPAAPVKYYLTFERTVFDRNANGPRPAEHVILFRLQLAL